MDANLLLFTPTCAVQLNFLNSNIVIQQCCLMQGLFLSMLLSQIHAIGKLTITLLNRNILPEWFVAEEILWYD